MRYRPEIGGIGSAVYSGAGPGWAYIDLPPSPWGRLSLANAATETVSFTQRTVARH
jgi:hypothetical protein